MKKLLFLLLCSCFSLLSAQSIIYVNQAATGPGNGTSWGTAFQSLQDALQAARTSPGADDIWLAQGTYYPHPTDKDSAFNIPAQVHLIGGFISGGNLGNRDQSGTTTILSGDINKDNVPSGNSHTVLYTQNVGNTTTIEGITITAGQGEVLVHQDTTLRQQSGAGVYNLAKGSQSSSPFFRKVIFKNNRSAVARDTVPYPLEQGAYGSHGGAFFNFAQNSATASPQFFDCSFEDNEAGLGGYGVTTRYFRDGKWWVNYIFAGAGGNGGAVAAVYKDQATGNLHFEGCSFKRNKAGKGGKGFWAGTGGNGGAIHIFDRAAGQAELSLKQCQFEMNEGGLGGDTLNHAVIDTTYGGMGGDGGAISCTNTKKLNITDCNFLQNHAGNAQKADQYGASGGNGGAIMFHNKVTDAEINLSKSTFDRNRGGDGSTGNNSGKGGDAGVAYIQTATHSLTIISDQNIFKDNHGGAGKAGIEKAGLVSAGYGGKGGVFYIHNKDNQHQADSLIMVFTNSDFYRNKGGIGGGFGGVFYGDTEFKGTRWHFDQCDFEDNAGAMGGFIYKSYVGDEGYAGSGGHGGVFSWSFNKGGPGTATQFADNNILFSTCNFKRNLGGKGKSSSTGNGGSGGSGGVFDLRNSVFTSGLKFKTCTFIENKTGNGGAGFTGAGSGAGGGVMAYYADSTDKEKFSFEACTFTGNETGDGGNALAASSSNSGGFGGTGGCLYMFTEKRTDIDIKDCTFTLNKTGNGGNAQGMSGAGYGGSGGVLALFSDKDDAKNGQTGRLNIKVQNSQFENNKTGNGGNATQGDGGYGGRGGCLNVSANLDSLIVHFTTSRFINNATGLGGTGIESPGNSGAGGVLSLHASEYDIAGFQRLHLHKCMFEGNKTGDAQGGSSGNGGALFLFQTNEHLFSQIDSCTFKQNHTGETEIGGSFTGHGGAISMYQSTQSTNNAGDIMYKIFDCLFEDNYTGNIKASQRTTPCEGFGIRTGHAGAIEFYLGSRNTVVDLTRVDFLNNRTGDSPNEICEAGVTGVAGALSITHEIYSTPAILDTFTLNINQCKFEGNHTGKAGDSQSEAGANSGKAGALEIKAASYQNKINITQTNFSDNYTGNAGNGARNMDAGISGHGGALVLLFNSSIPDSRGQLTLEHNTFKHNKTGNAGDGMTGGAAGGGGALYLEQLPYYGTSSYIDSLYVINNTFENNTTGNAGAGAQQAGTAGIGGAIYRKATFWPEANTPAHRSAVFVTQNLFINNSTGQGAGGFGGVLAQKVFSDADGPVIDSLFFVNNTTVNNTTNSQGSCLYGFGDDTKTRPNFSTHLSIRNGLFSGNLANGSMDMLKLEKNAKADTLYSMIEGYTGSKPNIYPAQPSFKDAANGDYTLASNSPAIDKGLNAYISLSKDFAGNARIAGQRVDLGAFEDNCGTLQDLTEQGCKGCGEICLKICQQGPTPNLVSYIKGNNTTYETGASLIWFADNAGSKGAMLNAAPTVNTSTNGKKYFWVRQSKNGCSSKDIRVKVQVKKLAVPVFTGFPSIGCGNSGAQLDLAKYVSDPTKKATKFTFYSQDPNANPNANPIGSVTAKKGKVKVGQNMIVTLNPNMPTYWVKVTVSNGCAGIASATISMPTVQASLNPIADITVIAGAPVNIPMTGQNVTNIRWFDIVNFNNPTIGIMGAVGSPPLVFTAQNNTASPKTAKIRVISYNGNCAGAYLDFNITVKAAGVPRQAKNNSLELFANKANLYDVALNWDITYDQELVRFEVEKELTEGEWHSIAAVNYDGNGHYDHIDQGGMGTINRYRLKLVHADGRIVWSRAVEVRFELHQKGLFSVFPNPSHGLITLKSLAPMEESYHWQLLNSLGQQLMKGEMTTAEISIDLQTLPASFYYIRIQSTEGHNFIYKITKE